MHGVISHGAPKIMMNSQKLTIEDLDKLVLKEMEIRIPQVSRLSLLPIRLLNHHIHPAPAPETLPQGRMSHW